MNFPNSVRWPLPAAGASTAVWSALTGHPALFIVAALASIVIVLGSRLIEQYRAWRLSPAAQDAHLAKTLRDIGVEGADISRLLRARWKDRGG